MFIDLQNFIFNLNIFLSGFFNLKITPNTLINLTIYFIFLVYLFFSCRIPYILYHCKAFSKYHNSLIIYKYFLKHLLKDFFITIFIVFLVMICFFIDSYFFSSNDSLFIIGEKTRNLCFSILSTVFFIFALFQISKTYNNISYNELAFIENTSIADCFNEYINATQKEITIRENFNNLKNSLPKTNIKNKLKI